MSAPSPLVPEGALPPSKGKSNVRIAIFTILAIHVVLLGGLLIQGCKPSSKDTAKSELPTLEPLAAPPQTETAALPVEQQPPTTAVVPTSDPVSVAPAATAPAVVSTPAVVAPVAEAPAVPASVPVTHIPAVPAADPVAMGETKVHSVAKGEMLSTIARKYKVSLKVLTDANPTVNPTKLQIGQKLNIPAPAARAEAIASSPVAVDAGDVYVVKPGDALEKIARNNKTTVKAIKALNNMRTDRIKVGDKLKLPTVTSAAVETAPAPYTVPTDVAAAPATTVVR